MKRQRMKDLLLRARGVDTTSNMEFSRPHLVDTSQNCIRKRAARAARLFFVIEPIKSLIFGVVVAVAVVKSSTP